MYKIIGLTIKNKKYELKNKLSVFDKEEFCLFKKTLSEMTGSNITLTYKEINTQNISKLKKVLFKIVNNIQKSDKIENREVLFLKGGIMLSKKPSGVVTIYDTKANENYVEITNNYLIYLILKEYETQQEQITQAIKSCANLEV